MGVLTLHSRIELELFVRYILLSFTGAPISLGLDMHTFKIHLVHIMVSKKKPNHKVCYCPSSSYVRYKAWRIVGCALQELGQWHTSDEIL